MTTTGTGLDLLRDYDFETKLIREFKEIKILCQRLEYLVKYTETKDLSLLEKEQVLEKEFPGYAVSSKENIAPNIVIKQEKISINPAESTVSSINSQTNDVLPGSTETMAPPQLPVKKRKIKEEPKEPRQSKPVRSTRSKIKKVSESSNELSQAAPDAVIADNDTEKSTQDRQLSVRLEIMNSSKAEPKRCTRSKTRQVVKMESQPQQMTENIVNETRIEKDKHDEKKEHPIKTPVKSKKQPINEVFSPYEKTSTKTKVEAFEKLNSAKKLSNSASKIPRPSNSCTTPAKNIIYTSFAKKNVWNSCEPKRNLKLDTTNGNDSFLSVKSLSALKASQAEYREREKLRKEKEREAQKKKEALLLAQAEEKKRKREEREKEREIRQKEEVEKKKQAAQKETESQETAKNNLTRSRNEEKRTRDEPPIPVYLKTKAPLLPCDDCYDSDDEEYRGKKHMKPAWCQSKTLYKQLYAQLVIKSKITNTLFCTAAQTPDLIDIFERIDPKKLKRTSSAVWKKLPRYTLFSTTCDIQFTDDSE